MSGGAVTGRVVAGVVVAGLVVTGIVVGGGSISTESATFTVAPASFDNRWRAAIEGRYGSTRNGASWYIPPNADGDTSYCVWWSHNGFNLDPTDHVDDCAGATGLEVALGSGNHTAAQVATATCAVLEPIENWSCTANGADVSLTGTIDASNILVGTTYTSRGAAALTGHHTTTVSTNGNPFNAVVAVHGTFTSGPAVLTSLCMLLGTAEADDTVRLGLYTGGSGVDFTGTALQAECTTAGSGQASGWACCQLDDADTVAIADNASVWMVGKGDQDDDTPADGTTTHPAFSTTAAREDWTNQNLTIITAGISNDPTVAFPATLAGTTRDDTNAVVWMASYETRAEPLVGDGSLGGTTTNGLILGMHCDDVLAASESNLLAPDPGGANVLASLTTPAILGMLETRREVAIGATHTAQFRLGEYAGGAIANPNGATILQDHGQTSGSSTNAWVGINASPEVSIAASSVLHMATRGNGNVTIRFAAAASPEIANCPTAPSDFATLATDEYETNTGNTNHSTNPATAYESPFVIDGDDLTPDNYPGVRVRFRVAGDSVAVP